MVDIAVGIFVIWGLYWAVREFVAAQVKPDLQLLVGRETEDHLGVIPLRNETDELVGCDDIVDTTSVSQVTIGLFLENNRPKAAQFVRITLRVRNTPPPTIFDTVGMPLGQVDLHTED